MIKAAACLRVTAEDVNIASCRHCIGAPEGGGGGHCWQVVAKGANKMCLALS